MDTKINILGKSVLFEERETGTLHTNYKYEKDFFDNIRKGSRSSVIEFINNIQNNGITIGRMSDNKIKQIKYWAISVTTLACRSAIEGGMDETSCYNFSDNLIFSIDKMNSEQEIVTALKDSLIILTDKVAESRENSAYPYTIRKCLHYINTHLHERLDITLLAEECELSPDHLSKLFKKNMGINLSNYIRMQKLTEAREMLKESYSISDIAYYLGFCSESYFIHCFKKEFGKTPKQYRNLIVK